MKLPVPRLRTRQARTAGELAPAAWSASRRLLTALVIVAIAGFTGVFWAQRRAGAVVDATVRAAVTAFVATDGAVQVVESLVVETEPARGVVERVIPLEPGHGARLRSVTESGADLVATGTAVPDGLLVRVETGRRLAVLRVTYDLLGIVEVGEDAAVVRLQLADRRNPLAWSGLSVDVSWLEGAGPPLDVVLEAEGATATVLPRGGGVRWEAGAVDAHRPVLLEVAVGPVAVSDLTPSAATPAAEMADRPDDVAVASDPLVDVVLPLALAAGFVGVWFALHRRRGREPGIDAPTEQRVPPSRTPPAELGWLLAFGAVTERDLAATLVDLHRRRHVHLDAAGDTLHRVLPEPADPLRPAELLLRDWLLPPGVDSVAVRGVTKSISDAPPRWQRLWQGFVDAVDAGGAADGLIDRRVGGEAVLALGLTSAAVLCAGVVGMATGRPWYLAVVAAGAVVMVFADTFARRSPTGADLAARWLRYRTHLAELALRARDPDAAAALLDALPWLPVLDLEDAAVGLGPDAAPLTNARAAVHAWHAAHVQATSFLHAPPPRRRRPTPPVHR